MNIFSFKGRAERSEYWTANILITVIGRVSYNIPDEMYENIAFSIGMIILSILMIWFVVAINTKRCHDLGHNGFWQLIPFYGIWMGFVRGEEGTNKYGPAPGQSNK